MSQRDDPFSKKYSKIGFILKVNPFLDPLTILKLIIFMSIWLKKQSNASKILVSKITSAYNLKARQGNSFLTLLPQAGNTFNLL
jgi:hypothetical protein